MAVMVPQLADTVMVVLAEAAGATTVRLSITLSPRFSIPTDFGEEKLTVASSSKLALIVLIVVSAGTSTSETLSPVITITPF